MHSVLQTLYNSSPLVENYLCAGRNAATIIAITLKAKDTRKAW